MFTDHHDVPSVHAGLWNDDPLYRTSTYTWDMPCSHDDDAHAYPSRISRHGDLSLVPRNDGTSTRDDDGLRCVRCDLYRRPLTPYQYPHLRPITYETLLLYFLV